MTKLCPVCWNTANDYGRLEESGDVIYVHESGRHCIDESSSDADKEKLVTDGGTRHAPPTERVELDDIETIDGTFYEVTRVVYYRRTDESGVCPFCESAEHVEFVDRTGPGGEWRKQRFECDCGAHGEGVWTWRAGMLDDATEWSA